jgi:DNA topoisomerase-3
VNVVLAEKPSVARDIARCLGASSKRTGYLEGNGWCVTWAFGHLVELEEPEAYDASLKRWNLAPLPFVPEVFKLRIAKRKGVYEQFQIIKKLFQQASEIVCATDAGREGELIFRYIQEKARAKGKPTRRLWISSLTDSAIRQGLAHLRPLAQFDHLADAARCRSEADWIIGLNSTRAYTVQYSHGQGVLSVGRVQTPVLAMIVNRDRTIRDFRPEDYWELATRYRDVKFKHEKDRFAKEEEANTLLQKVLNAPFSIVDIQEKSSSQPPPLLFDLTELQRTMNRICGLSASRTLALAQTLYEAKLISYPRTDSKYLSDDIFPQCAPTLQKLSARYPAEIAGIEREPQRSRRFFNNAKVSDHHAIIPTGHLSNKLERDAQKVFDVIVKRFVAIFYPNCDKAHTHVQGRAAGETFKAKGTRVIKPGWMALYQRAASATKDENEEQSLPAFKVGENGPHFPEVKKCQTKPPAHFNEASLLGAMETAGRDIDDDELKEAMKDKGLGTPATRAAIIEVLVAREYIAKKGKLILAAEKGERLIGLLQGQTTLTSPELTGDWEHKLKLIEKGEFAADLFMGEVRRFADAIIGQVKSGNAQLGLGSCPLCGAPVITGKKGGYGCSQWKSGCPFRFHGEQFGVSLTEDHVRQLLARGRLSRVRKLVLPDGTETQGYISLDKQRGSLGITTKVEKEQAESIGTCPSCGGSVMERHKSYSCSSCDFVIWKTIVGKKVSVTLAKLLLNKGRSMKLKGFRSKAGKRFSCTLVLRDNKVELEF